MRSLTGVGPIVAVVLAMSGCGEPGGLSSGELLQLRADNIAASAGMPVEAASLSVQPDAGAASDVDGVAAEETGAAEEGGEEVGGQVEYRFTGIIVSTTAIGAHNGPVLSLDRDARFAVVVQVLRQLDGRPPVGGGDRLALGVHSLSRSFPAQMFPLEGQLLEFTIVRQADRQGRELEVARVPE